MHRFLFFLPLKLRQDLKPFYKLPPRTPSGPCFCCAFGLSNFFLDFHFALLDFCWISSSSAFFSLLQDLCHFNSPFLSVFSFFVFSTKEMFLYVFFVENIGRFIASSQPFMAFFFIFSTASACAMLPSNFLRALAPYEISWRRSTHLPCPPLICTLIVFIQVKYPL